MSYLSIIYELSVYVYLSIFLSTIIIVIREKIGRWERELIFRFYESQIYAFNQPETH